MTQNTLLLSSGLDSNFIKSIIEDNLNKKITSFTYGWKNKYYDEILKLKKLKSPHFGKIKKIYKRSWEKFFMTLKSWFIFMRAPLGGFVNSRTILFNE